MVVTPNTLTLTVKVINEMSVAASVSQTRVQFEIGTSLNRNMGVSVGSELMILIL